MNQEREFELADRGWTTFLFSGDLLDMASRFGKPVASRSGGPLLDLLTVKASEEAHPNSLSARFGVGAFPFHTDAAHHENVPRLIFMRLIQPQLSLRKTILVDIRSVLDANADRTLRSEIWRFHGGRRSFLSPIMGDDFLRFDLCIMKPAVSQRKAAVDVINRIIVGSNKVAIEWQKERVLVLDNRRMVHSREGKPAAEVEPEPRVLERVMVL